MPAAPPLDARRFEAQVRSLGYAGTVGLLVCTWAGELLCGLNAQRPFPAASTIKVALLLRALTLAQTGELDLTARVTLAAADRVPGAGVLHELDAGVALTWRDVLTLMTVVSDNTATNLLIGRLGLQETQRWLVAQGLSDTRLVGLLQVSPERQTGAQRRGERNQTSASDQMTLLMHLTRGTLLDPAHTALALDLLRRQQERDLLGRHLPHSADGRPLYSLASKRGELPGIHHDVGLLDLPRPLAVVLLSEGGRDPREAVDNRDVRRLAGALWPLLARLGQVSGAVWEGSGDSDGPSGDI